jgi:hypothetical protein
MGIKEFEDISVPKWKLTMNATVGKVYRVFKNATEFETVQAESAAEAMKKCECKKVFKILSGSMNDTYMLDRSMLLEG